MSTKKPAKKNVSAKKSTLAKNSAPEKKVSAKNAASAKTAPAKKAPPAKKAVPVKKAVSSKKPASAGKAVPSKKPASPKRPPAKPAKPVVPDASKADAGASGTGAPLDFAYSIAEMMKRENRRKEEEAAAAEKSVHLSRRPTSRAKGKDTQKFPAADLAEFNKRLLQLRQTATGQSVNLKSIALEQTDDHGTEDDDGSDAFLRLQSLSQVDSKNKLIFKIDEALRRIADGTYGICEVCGQLIRKPRLMNMPFVHTCMECQSAMESPSGARG